MPWLQGRTPGEDDNEKKEPVSKYGNLKDPSKLLLFVILFHIID